MASDAIALVMTPVIKPVPIAINQLGRDDPAHLLDEGTTTSETAAGRRVDRARRISAQRRRSDPLVGIHGQARGQEPLRVGMGSAAENSIRRTDFDHPAEIHDHDAIRNKTNHVQVVRDEKICQRQAAAEVDQKIQHLRVDRFIERRDRLVHDDQSRVEAQRARDIDTLALASGKLVRMAGGVAARIEPDSDSRDRAPVRRLRAASRRAPSARKRACPRCSSAD